MSMVIIGLVVTMTSTSTTILTPTPTSAISKFQTGLETTDRLECQDADQANDARKKLQRLVTVTKRWRACCIKQTARPVEIVETWSSNASWVQVGLAIVASGLALGAGATVQEAPDAAVGLGIGSGLTLGTLVLMELF